MLDHDDRLVNDEPEHQSPFDHFLGDGLITEVLRIIKSGKESDVYLCRANPRLTGVPFAVAKMHRPRQHRDFRDDSTYLDGRFRKVTNEVRAMRAKGRVGREFAHAFWVAHEWETLVTLHAAGADVPRPIAQSGAGLLMDYLGDQDGPAPQLRTLSPGPGEARRILDRLLRNVELLLANNVVHADLSAFNVLWWDDRPWIIDLPQAVDPRFNHSSYELLARDVRNVCAWAERHGVDADAERLAADLWTAWLFADL